MLMWRITQYCSYVWIRVYSREDYLRLFPATAREPPTTYPRNVYTRRCYEVKTQVWVSFESPTAVRFRANGQRWGEKEIIAIEPRYGEWKVIEERKNNPGADRSKKEIVIKQEQRERTLGIRAEFAGFAVPIGVGKYIIRKKS